MSDDQQRNNTSPAGRQDEPGGATGGARAAAPAGRIQAQEADAKGGGSEELEAAVKGLQEQSAQLQDQLLRKTAEFENFRKRMFREREEGIRYANAALLEDVLPIIDGFERAIASAEESRDFDALHDGVSLIERQLVSVLDRNWGLKRFSAAGEPFDPQRHEAIAVQDSSEHAEPVVLEDLQKGYYLHDRVLRAAKVKVSRPVESIETKGKDSTSSK
jgi:molecular chaperone GrpE